MKFYILNKIFLFGLIFFTVFCSNKKNENKVKLDILPLLTDPGKIYLLSNGIDMDLTPNCGTGTPATASTTSTGTTTTTSSKTANTRFTILSQLIMKTTKETLTVKFIYDTTQTQGQIDQQQGFTFTGGAFSDTVTGKQGTVKWVNQGVNIDDTNQGTQIIQFMNVTLNLQGTYTAGTGTTTTPTECYTSDSINCTSTTTTTKCFTTDNKICLSSATSSTGGTSIIIKGTLNCNAKNVTVSS